MTPTRAILLLSLAVGACASCRKTAIDTRRAATAPQAVRVAPVERKRIQPTLETFGTIVYQNKADVYPGSEGRLEQVLVEEGTSVRNGQVIAVLSSAPLEATRERVSAEVASKEALLALAEERLREGSLAVEARLLAVRKAEAELALRQAECDNLAQVYSNKKQLYEAGGVAEGELEGFRTRFLSAQQALAQAESDLEIERLGFRDEDLISAGWQPPMDPGERHAALLLVNTRMLAAELDVAAAELAAAKSELRRVESLLEETAIRCPIDGIVAARLLDPGEKVSPDTLLFTVFNTRTVYAQAEVGEGDLPTLRRGQAAAVLVGEAQAPSLTLAGRLELISPYMHPQSRTARIRVRLDNPQGQLVPGLFVRLRIQTGQARECLVIPQAALRDGEAEQTDVFVVRGENAFRQVVQLGTPQGVLAVVQGGLSEGELVILDPPAALREGTCVEVLP